jgi:hypothetical protein
MTSQRVCGCETVTSVPAYLVVEEIDPNGLDDWAWLSSTDETDTLGG